MIRLSFGVLLLMFGVQPADAACTLKGSWDVYLTLSHLNDEGTGLPWPPATAVCSFPIDRHGRASAVCDGVWEGRELEVFVSGSDLKLDRNCRILDTAELLAVVQTGFEQTQDEYFCRPQGTMVRSGQALDGLLDCGHVPEPFAMVRQFSHR